jgi:hypothetical protein
VRLERQDRFTPVPGWLSNDFANGGRNLKYKLPTLLLTLFVILALVPVALADDVDWEEPNTYCMDLETLRHPVGERIAERYAVEYEWVMGWFCDSAFGFGEIMLALETSKVTTPTPTDLEAVVDLSGLADKYLNDKIELGGWGQVWKSLGFNGRPKSADWDDGKPDWAGPKDKDGDDDDLETAPVKGPKDKDRKKPLSPTAGPKKDG